MNNNRPKITVITVAFNACKALMKTMKSIDNQDYPNLEYIVVDGNSADNTVENLRAYKGRLDRWVSESDKGIYDAMNKGVAMATGDYCIFMNAGDCFANESVVSQAVKHFHDNDVIYGDITKNNKIKASLSPRNCHKMYYCHQAVFTSTNCLKEFPFDNSHSLSADLKQAKQMFLSGKKFLQLQMVIADFDTGGISNVQRSKGLWDNIRVVAEVDSFFTKLRLIPRLLFTYLLCKVRKK